MSNYSKKIKKTVDIFSESMGNYSKKVKKKVDIFSGPNRTELDPNAIRAGIDRLLLQNINSTPEIEPTTVPVDNFAIFRNIFHTNNPEDESRYDTLNNLGIVFALLRNSTVLKTMNLDERNLRRFLQAIFSKATGKYMTEKDIYKLNILEDQKKSNIKKTIYKTLDNIIFTNILKLQNETDPDVMRKEIDKIVDAYQQLEPTIEQQKLFNIAKKLMKIPANERDLTNYINDIPDTPEKFNDQIIDDMLEQSNIAQKNPDISNQQPLAKLFEAFKAEYADTNEYNSNYKNSLFNGDDLDVVIENINNVFSEKYIDIGTELHLAVLDVQDGIAMPEDLKDKLDEIDEKLKDLYPALSGVEPQQSDEPPQLQGLQEEEEEEEEEDIKAVTTAIVVKEPSNKGILSKLEKFEAWINEVYRNRENIKKLLLENHTKYLKRPINYKKLYNKLKKSPKTKPYIRSIYKMYQAIKTDDANFDKNMLDKEFGVGFEKMMTDVTKVKTKRPVTLTLQGIGKHFSVGKDTEKLKEKLKEIHEKLENFYS